MNTQVESEVMISDRECFIVTPIGSEKDTIRRHIDGLIDASLTPVLKEHGYKVEVAHRITTPGSINKQVITKLYKSDLVIANLTGLNPNVMYELAFRHSIRKPVIIIAEEGTTKLPFDIISERTIFYTNDFQGSIDLREGLSKMISTINDELSKGEPINNAIYDYLNEADIEEDIIKSIKPTKPEEANIYKYILNKLDSIENEISKQKNQRNTRVPNKGYDGSESFMNIDNIKRPSGFNNKLDLLTLTKIIEKSIDETVAYRLDGDRGFKKDIINGYEITPENSAIEIKLREVNIINTNITEIAYTRYEERIDIWIYGDETNRLNINIPAYILNGII